MKVSVQAAHQSLFLFLPVKKIIIRELMIGLGTLLTVRHTRISHLPFYDWI
jgi:hypothetical protein